ncbi:MAG: ribbon-helix-helix domain-containing protein [Hyphomicrobiales bacterium]
MKRSITLSGHRTSVSLEAPFWDALRDIATHEKTSPTEIIMRIDEKRLPEDNLSSAIRIYILHYYQKR